MIQICYGTDTGTAAAVSQSILREAARYGIKCRIFDGARFSSFQRMHFLSAEVPTLFIISTCGQGQLPPSWSSLWNSLLVRSLPSDLFSSSFAPFAFVGLGDSAYPHFNYAGKKLRRRLLNLGARELCEPCWCDASSALGTWACVRAWQSACLWPNKVALLPPYTQQLPEPRFTVVVVQEEEEESAVPSSSKWKLAHISASTLLTDEKYWQTVKHVDIMVADGDGQKSPPLQHNVGDVVHILPAVPSDPVVIKRPAANCVDPRVLRDRSCRWAPRIGIKQAAEILQLPPLDSVVRVSEGFSDNLVFPATLECVLTYCVDLEAPVSRWDVTCMAAFAKEAHEKARLLELLADDNAMDDWATREGRSLVEAIQEFPSCIPIPLCWILEIAQPLHSRPFSIASAAPRNPSVCVSTLRWVSPLGRVRSGLCSQQLTDAPVGTPLYVCIKETGLKAEPSWAQDDLLVVCCGSGAGLAKALVEAKSEWQGAGKWTVIAGHRSIHTDALYSQFFHQAVESFTLEQYVCAFSRDESPERVPQVIRKCKGKVSAILTSAKGRLIVTGRAGPMPRDVKGALVDVLVETIPNVTEEGAKKHIKGLEARKRLHWEVWG